MAPPSTARWRMVEGPAGERSPSALFTDLYEVAMAQTYWRHGIVGRAVFETFFRTLPRERSFAICAGLADVVDFLEGFRFTDDELEYLKSQGSFSADFLQALKEVRFTGELWAIPEGTVVFGGEPLVRIVAPILEAQLFETLILNQIHLQTVIASKAARVVIAAEGRQVVEFGARRAHGIDAAMKLARTSYLAGAAGTSNLLAGKRYGIPTYGTMAHSFVQIFDDEGAAFETFATSNPGTTLLVDTYDTLQGVDRVIELARKLGSRFDVQAIRLDSGDMASLSRGARAKLDAAGLESVRIFASSGLDETRIAALVEGGAPIDGFGVGTNLGASADAPTLDMVYKLVEYDGVGRVKLSSEKVLYPGPKQVHRRDKKGILAGDIVGQAGEELPGEPLLLPMMKGGARLPGIELGLEAARSRARLQLAALPPSLRSLDPALEPYPVEISPRLEAELAVLRSDREASASSGVA